MEAQRRNDGGYVTLLVTLIVTTIGSALAFSLAMRAGYDARTTETLERSFQARNFADACAEEALLRITETESYAGEESLGFAGGSCDFSVVSNGSESVIESVGNAGDAIRRVRVVAETQAVVAESGTTTEILDTAWSEPADF